VDNAAQITALYSRVREILDSARRTVARSVNTTHVVANWLIGREIVEEQQRGRKRAGYGKRLLYELSARLQVDYGKSFSTRNLEYCRDFYLTYATLMELDISHALPGESIPRLAISNALRSESTPTMSGELLSGQYWQPGQLHPNLSWTHCRVLLRVEKTDARAFYEIEAVDNNWSARELERQINSLYLPSEEELREEIRREVRRLPPCQPSPSKRRKANKP